VINHIISQLVIRKKGLRYNKRYFKVLKKSDKGNLSNYCEIKITDTRDRNKIYNL